MPHLCLQEYAIIGGCPPGLDVAARVLVVRLSSLGISSPARSREQDETEGDEGASREQDETEGDEGASREQDETEGDEGASREEDETEGDEGADHEEEAR